MKCYYSPTEDAIGICKSCGKGLSREHAVDLGRGLACKGRCEEDVKALIRVIQNSVAISGPSTDLMRKSGRAVLGQALFLSTAGAFFFGFGVYQRWEPFSTGLGSIFLVYSVFVFLRAHRLSRMLKEPTA